MLDSVYNSTILDYAGNIQRLGRLENPDATAKAHSKLCGSTVIIDLKMEEGKVTDFAHDVKACALGQASSSIMARSVIGATGEELKQLKREMYAMLKDGGPPPQGKFAEFRFLEPVREYKARHASTLLTFDAVVDCVEEIEARQKTERREKINKAKGAALHALALPASSTGSVEKPAMASRNWQGEWPKTPGRLLGIGLIRLYQLTLSGFVGNSCRHYPTCSEFGYEAIARHGLLPGSWLTFWRVIRCNPWGTSGHDPVPHEMRWWQRR